MTDIPQNPRQPKRERAPGVLGHVAAIVALVALAVMAVAWFWSTRQPPQAGLGVPEGVIVLGAGTFIAALIAEIRAMSFWDVLEAAWDLFTGLVWMIGAILKGIWSFICGLFGWD